MGDLSTEPSMEEILSSIKRIIAEEGEGSPQRGRRQPRATTAAPTASQPSPPLVGDEMDEDEVLELSDPMPANRPEFAPRPAATASAPESIVSPEAAAASRGALDSLSRLMIKPEPGSDGSLEGLVREMLRPMLREWLDANLPELVETMVSREIKRITGQPG